jgi:tight adherence protein C
MIVGILAGLSLAEGGRRIVLGIVFAGVAGYLPGFLLSRAASRRAAAIDAELPHFVDQLAIAIEAGMSFDAAVSYLAEANDGPLADELHRILSGLRMGESRRAAMRGFAERVGSENAIAFTNAVLSSDQLGSPLAGILRAQAADLRHRRQMSAEERAQKAPVKMLFPIAIFILPVMFVVILAPAFLGEGLF